PATTAGIHGTVWFTNAAGQPTQPMQGVNVVARWIDPSTGQPSRQYAASSVSGAFFTGNAGNPITGFYDPLGNLFSNWGSSTASMEGFFDISGLQIPNGATSTQYELTVENLDPLWSMGVQPYGPFQVALSGQSALTVVNVTLGADVEQDILMAGSAQPVAPWAASQTWTVPAALPAAADWMESLNGYGNEPYFSFSARANRTLSVAVTALDENGNPSAVKAQPVIGMWAASDPEGTPPGAFTPSALNTPMLGLTRLDAQILSPTQFLVGIADMRGDGRPDYRYHAHVLYGDSVVPSRISASGGAITVQGMGFAPGQIVAIGSANVSPLEISSGQIILEVPAQPDGTQTITITDPVTGSSSVMTGVFTLGASATDNIVLVRGLNPPTPVGTQTVNPVTVQVVAADGVTPVAGATIAWSSTNSAALSACGGAFSCSTASDEVGSASTFVVPDAAGVATITAALAPLSYNSAKSVSATVLGTLAASQIGVATPYLYIAQGASLTIPLTARVLSNGVPQSAATVNFNMTTGSGSLSATSATTNSTGYATVDLTLSQFAATVQVNACVAQPSGPCAPTYAIPVPLPQQKLQPVAGGNQIVALGQAFQPIVVRVTDSSSPPNPVLGASVAFENIVERSSENSATGNSAAGDSCQSNPVMPDILSVSQSIALTDFSGLASVEPSAGSFNGTLEVNVLATAGISAMLNYVLEALPEAAETGGSNTIPSSRGNPVRPPQGWLEK
ncbi:MAG TPA: IPT/TIG domain-containing protein, partial [Candidatus Sulfotelmatobacter sp.]